MLANSLQQNQTWMWLLIYWNLLAAVTWMLIRRWKSKRDVAFYAEWNAVKSDVYAKKDFSEAIEYAIRCLAERGVRFSVVITDNYPGCDKWVYVGTLGDATKAAKHERRRRYALVRDVGWNKENAYSWLMEITVVQNRNPADEREPISVHLSGEIPAGGLKDGSIG